MSKASDYSKYGLARLQAELEQEREMKQMLEESVCDLRSTMCELQERLQSVDGEGNEWKTRYETQVELNGQLERQLSLIHERLEDMKGNPVDRLASIRSYEDMPLETLRHRLKLLTEEKSDLQTQLMDCHLQIGQEGKAFHKTNSERRAFLSEIAKLSSTHEARRMRHFARPQRAPESKEIRGKQTDRKAEADSKKGKEGGEEEGGEACVKERGGGGGGRRAERKEEKKLQRKSRFNQVLETFL
ncbi:coiled-coil domain-containing protein 169 isoform X2 [Archocentrus centrarchus]|uniref:coiled-coil domain-containing protein 169 isoform X2 n=1 Tax=Archocentrus centrarchus TaxID=63155 RepID=UPI0011EA2932|nr:coiled-coil domain-containing protein 169 isoform X2 [Archocentrus centrarchus]